MCHDALNGPDWTDVRRVMTGIEKTHDVVCSLLLLPDGRVDGTSWCLIAGAIPIALPLSDPNGGVVLSIRWPNSEHSTLAGAAFQLLYSLDFQCSKSLYAQGELWP